MQIVIMALKKSKKNRVYEKLCQQLAVMLSEEETTAKGTILITRCELQKVGERKNFINIYCVYKKYQKLKVFYLQENTYAEHA